MATTHVRVQYQFVDTSDSLANGWTETFYFAATGAQAALNVVGSLPNIALRTAIMGLDYRMTQVRCVAVGNRPDVAQQVLTPAQGQGQYGTPNEQFNSEQPWDALLIRLFASGASIRSFALRGVPTGIMMDTMNIGTAQPGYLNNLRIWTQYIANARTATAFSVRQLLYPNTTPVSLTSIGPTPRSLVLTLTNPIPGWIARGITVRVRNVVGVSPNVNHLWRIQDVNPNVATTLVTLYPGRRNYYGIPAGPVQLDQVTTTNFNPITLATPIRGMKRSTGRPPALLRGSSRGRRT